MLFVTQIQDSYIGMVFPGRENKKSAQRHKPSDALKHGNYTSKQSGCPFLSGKGSLSFISTDSPMVR